jgi:8-oxo-dGTP pyrophosphatase MutT (NUDIX family)
MLLRLKRLAYRIGAPVLHACWEVLGTRHDGVKCVVGQAEDVLLVRHTYGDRRRWDFPGGFIRPGEAPAAAARRELGEELGLDLDPAALSRLGRLSVRHGRRRAVVHYFLVDLAHRTVDPDPVELAEAAWFSPGELPGRVGEHVRQALAWTAAPEVTAAGRAPATSTGSGDPLR